LAGQPGVDGVRSITGDVLIIESEHDELVPHQVIENYVAAFVSAKSMTSRVISGADHALTSERAQQAYNALLEGWLSEMVVGARAGSAGEERMSPTNSR